jgi:hypothetical protein
MGVFVVVFLVREVFSIYKYSKNYQLHEAAKTNQVDKVRKLLKEGHPVDALAPRFGLAPLQIFLMSWLAAISVGSQVGPKGGA